MKIDDYVTKPFSMPILLRKITAVLSRVTGDAVNLTTREFELLRELLQNQGRVLTRSVLLGQLWSYVFPGDERIETVISRTCEKS